jgi:hypothetical protein
MLEAIQKMIDQRVEEKVASIQKEYEDLKSKVSKNVSSMFKPGSLGGAGQRTAQSEVKTKAA